MREAAELCGVSLRALRRRADRGTLRVSKQEGYRTVAVDDLVEAGLLPAGQQQSTALPRPWQQPPGQQPRPEPPPAQPRYRVVRFCRSAESLWELLASGSFEWLGVLEGVYLAGSPCSRGTAPAPVPVPATVVDDGAEPGRHGVVVRTPLGVARRHWHRSAAEARTAFEQSLATVRASARASIARVELIEDGVRVGARTVAGTG